MIASGQDFPNAPDWLYEHLFSDGSVPFQYDYACALSPIKDVLVVNLFHYNCNEPEFSMVATKTGFVNLEEATENDIPNASDVGAPMFESLATLSVFHSPYFLLNSGDETNVARDVMKLEVVESPNQAAGLVVVLFEGEQYNISMIGVPEIRQAFRVAHLVHVRNIYEEEYRYPDVTFAWRGGQTFFNRHTPKGNWLKRIIRHSAKRISAEQSKITYVVDFGTAHKALHTQGEAFAKFEELLQEDEVQ